MLAVLGNRFPMQDNDNFFTTFGRNIFWFGSMVLEFWLQRSISIFFLPLLVETFFCLEVWF